MFARPSIWKILIAIYFNVINGINSSQAAVTPSAMTSFNCSQPPKFDDFDIGQCCRFPAINLGQAVEKCHQHIKSLKSYNDKYPVYAHVCYPECIYRETNALKGNDDDNDGGDIQLENVQKFLTTNIEQRDKNIVPTILQSFKSCLTNIRQHMQAKGIKAYPKLTELGCSPYASLVYGCVNAETFLQCPPEMWQQQQQSCNLARSFAQQCNPLPHVPMPMI